MLESVELERFDRAGFLRGGGDDRSEGSLVGLAGTGGMRVAHALSDLGEGALLGAKGGDLGVALHVVEGTDEVAAPVSEET